MTSEANTLGVPTAPRDGSPMTWSSHTTRRNGEHSPTTINHDDRGIAEPRQRRRPASIPEALPAYSTPALLRIRILSLTTRFTRAAPDDPGEKKRQPERRYPAITAACRGGEYACSHHRAVPMNAARDGQLRSDITGDGSFTFLRNLLLTVLSWMLDTSVSVTQDLQPPPNN